MLGIKGLQGQSVKCVQYLDICDEGFESLTLIQKKHVTDKILLKYQLSASLLSILSTDILDPHLQMTT